MKFITNFFKKIFKKRRYKHLYWDIERYQYISIYPKRLEELPEHWIYLGAEEIK